MNVEPQNWRMKTATMGNPLLAVASTWESTHMLSLRSGVVLFMLVIAYIHSKHLTIHYSIDFRFPEVVVLENCSCLFGIHFVFLFLTNHTN